MTDVVRDNMTRYVISLSQAKGKAYAKAVLEVANVRFQVQVLKHTGHAAESLNLALQYKESIAQYLHTLGINLTESTLHAFFNDCEGLLDIYAQGVLMERDLKKESTNEELKEVKELADDVISKAMRM